MTAVLADIAMLATRLNKPLTARLMPIPGLAVGDPTTYTFSYFHNSRVMPIVGDGVSGLIQEGKSISINKINKKGVSKE